MWWLQKIAFSLSTLTDSSLVLCSVNVLVTTVSMRQNIQPCKFGQVVQLFQDGTSIRVVANMFAVCPSTVARAWKRYREAQFYTPRARHVGGHRPRSRTTVWRVTQTSMS